MAQGYLSLYREVIAEGKLRQQSTVNGQR